MEKKNIYQRIVGVMADLDYIQKEQKKVNNQYTFVSHDAVTAKIHPLLVKHGIACLPSVDTLTQDGNRTTVCLTVQFVNIDTPSDFISVKSWGYGIDGADKGPGKAISYAFKYAILKTFCLETGDDPDQDQQSEYQPPRISTEDLKEYLKEISGHRYELTDLEDYLNYLNGVKGVAIPKIIEQARNPSLAERFCEGWSKWYSQKESQK